MNPQSKPRPASASAAHRRGSTVVLVIGILLLMIISGMAYVEVTRQERRASFVTNNNCDNVTKAIISQIQKVLLDDVVYTDASGVMHYFDENLNVKGYGGIEPYDYPYTSNENPASEPRNDWYNSGGVTLSDGTLVHPRGGHRDDAWLASTYPSFASLTNPTSTSSSGQCHWPHITNLNGVWIELPTSTANLNMAVPRPTATNSAGSTIAMEYAVDSVRTTGTDYPLQPHRSDTRLIIANNGATASAIGWLHGRNPNDATGELQLLGADADGDGIPDSRWTWAPIRQIGGVKYVMAVRIIDNSSLLNVNVATAVTSNGSYTGASPARFWFPSELNLDSFVKNLGGSTTNELPKLLTYRQPGAAVPMPWTLNGSSTNIGINDRAYRFASTADRTYGMVNAGGTTHSFTIEDELELRHRNGLHSGIATTTIEDSNHGMPAFFRSRLTTAGAERHYQNLTANPGTLAFSNLATTMTTVNGYPRTHNTTAIRQFYARNPRTLSTVHSGAATYATPYLGETSSNRMPLKVSLSDVTTTNLPVIKAELAAFIAATSYAVPAPFATADEFATALSVSIKDYVDNDNKITTWNNFCGMEALPFICETYAQGYYKVTSADPDPAGTPNRWINLKWERQGEAGYAVEIRNPFRRDVKTEFVHVYVDGNDWGDLKSLTNLTKLAPNDTVIVFHNSTSGQAGQDNVSALFTGSSPQAPNPLAIGKTWPNTDQATCDIELRIDAVDENNAVKPPITYVRYKTRRMPDNFTDPGPVTHVGTPANALEGWVQSGSVGSGNELNMITVTPKGVGTHQANEWDHGYPTPVAGYNTSNTQFGKADKTGGGGPSDLIPVAANRDQQLIIADSGRLGTILELGQISWLAPTGGSPGKTVAEMWAAAGTNPKVDNFRLNLSSTNPVYMLPTSTNTPETYPDYAVPAADLIANRFTTIDPRHDGVDNNGDGVADDEYEQLVPGTINLNTISGDLTTINAAEDHLLQKILPIPDTNLRQMVARAIIRYRELVTPYNASAAGNDARTTPTFGAAATNKFRRRPGIAHIGELFSIVDNTVPNPASASVYHGLDYLGKDTQDNFNIGGVTIDTTPGDGATPADTTAADGVKDDREEKIMIAKWLSGVCSTRSDVFTAYILIRAYPAEDFRNGPLEQRRYIVVFDRSGIVKGKLDEVKVLGIREF